MHDQWEDPSVLEAASWRLASELTRRHPKTTRLLLTHPGGGMYDCLSIYADRKFTGPPGVEHPGTIHLNRVGSIQVHERFDGGGIDWVPTSWEEYLRADPREFLGRLEAAAGLPALLSTPAATRESLTHRVLAAIAASAVKSVNPIRIESGYIDSSGDSGPNRQLEEFRSIPAELRQPVDGDVFGEPGYRFWIVLRAGRPLLAFERCAGLVFTARGGPAVDVMKLYEDSRRNLHFTMANVLRLADDV